MRERERGERIARWYEVIRHFGQTKNPTRTTVATTQVIPRSLTFNECCDASVAYFLGLS